MENDSLRRKTHADFVSFRAPLRSQGFSFGLMGQSQCNCVLEEAPPPWLSAVEHHLVLF